MQHEDSSKFVAWQIAEQASRQATLRFFSGPRLQEAAAPSSAEEVANLHHAQARASGLLREFLEATRLRADALRWRHLDATGARPQKIPAAAPPQRDAADGAAPQAAGSA